jgi:hypothetical protein
VGTFVTWWFMTLRFWGRGLEDGVLLCLLSFFTISIEKQMQLNLSPFYIGCNYFACCWCAVPHRTATMVPSFSPLAWGQLWADICAQARGSVMCSAPGAPLKSLTFLGLWQGNGFCLWGKPMLSIFGAPSLTHRRRTCLRNVSVLSTLPLLRCQREGTPFVSGTVNVFRAWEVGCGR